MKIYFIRHGETDWNKEGKMQGRTDIPLNESGRFVAELTREALKEIPFDAAFTSPLKRAKETAQIIMQGRDAQIIDEERVIEVSFGTYEGIKMEDWDENLTNFFQHPEAYVATEGGETIEEVLERESDFLQELYQKEEYKDSTVLVSSHGAALSGLLTVIKNNPVSKYWAGGLHKNCGITIVKVKDGVPEILEEAIIVYDETSLKHWNQADDLTQNGDK